jgi:hypothetical protein
MNCRDEECELELDRPSGTWIISSTFPSAEALGYVRSPLRGWILFGIAKAMP